MKKIIFLLFIFIVVASAFHLLQAQVICSEEYKFIKKRDNLPLVLDTSRPTGPKKRGTFTKKSRWQVGSTLRIKFMDGTDTFKQMVKKFAPEWSKYANIKFDFRQDDDADIRISFDSIGESWSWVGRDAQLQELQYSTMSLGFFKEYFDKKKTDSFFSEITLHEFGHALGLEHEHLSPVRGFQWISTDSVYKYYLGPPNFMDSATIQRNMFTKLDASHSNGKYDPKSIMHYTLPAKLLKDNFKTPNNFFLSEGDKATIASLYPFDTTTKTQTSNAKCKSVPKSEVAISDNNNLVIQPSFTITGAKENYIKLVIFFYDEKGIPIVNANASHLKNNNQAVAVKENIYITSNSEEVNKYEDIVTSVAMPLTDLYVTPGVKKVIKYKVGVYWRRLNLAMSKMFSVTLNEE